MTVEISMYPFNADYKTLIKDFIMRLNAFDGLVVKTTATSTMVKGDYLILMDALKDLIAWSYQTHGRSVFVTKFIPGYDPE